MKKAKKKSKKPRLTGLMRKYKQKTGKNARKTDGKLSHVYTKWRKSLKKDEMACGKSECGRCKIPDPMNTHTKGEARFGFSLLFTQSYQQSLKNKFGRAKAISKLNCEYNRIKQVLIKQYFIPSNHKFKALEIKI